MNRRDFLRTAAIGGVGSLQANQSGTRKPNIVIIFLDDSGYADFRPFGKTPYPTPNVEKLASEGCQFHEFYVPQAICSASRSALLSGCYPGRTGVVGAHSPGARGLDPSFATMGQVLKTAGYRTAPSSIDLVVVQSGSVTAAPDIETNGLDATAGRLSLSDGDVLITRGVSLRLTSPSAELAVVSFSPITA